MNPYLSSKYRNALPKQKQATSLPTYSYSNCNTFTKYKVSTDKKYLINKFSDNKIPIEFDYDDIIVTDDLIITLLQKKLYIYSIQTAGTDNETNEITIKLLHECNNYTTETKVNFYLDTYTSLLFIFTKSFIDFYEIAKVLVNGTRFICDIQELKMVRKEYLTEFEVVKFHVKNSKGSFDLSLELERKNGVHDYCVNLDDFSEDGKNERDYENYLKQKVNLNEHLQKQKEKSIKENIGLGSPMPSQTPDKTKTPEVPQEAQTTSLIPKTRTTSQFKHLSSKSLHSSHSIPLPDKPNTHLSNESHLIYASSTHLLFSSSSFLYVIPYTISHQQFTKQSTSQIRKIDANSLSDYDINDKFIAYSNNEKVYIVDYELNTKCVYNANKVNLVKFHPIIDELIVIYDGSLVFYSVSSGVLLKYDSEYVCSVDFYEKSVCLGLKDGRVKCFDLKNSDGFSVGNEISIETGMKSCKALFVGCGILVCGLVNSARELRVYDFGLKTMISKLEMSPSPSNFMLHYDKSNKLLYCSGRGDGFISVVEVTEKLELLPRYESSSTLGICFLDKKCVNVKEVEIMRCIRCTTNIIEQIVFSVPRQKKDYFQDDLYPEYKVYKSATLNDYLNDKVEEKTISLKPDGMVNASSITIEVPKKKVFVEVIEEKKQEKLLEEMFSNAKMDEESGPLEQDLMEGVADDEWDD